MSRKDRFLAALGLVSTNYQVLEKYVEFFVWTLIGQDQEIGQILTSQMSFRRLCDTLCSLFRHRVQDSEMVEELEGIIKKAAQAEERRNALIHSSWWGLESTDLPVTRLKITSKRKRGLKHTYESMDPDDLREVALFIKEVVEELQDLIDKAQDEGIVNITSYQIKTPAT